jgi:hypothetical protein
MKVFCLCFWELSSCLSSTSKSPVKVISDWPYRNGSIEILQFVVFAQIVSTEALRGASVTSLSREALSGMS